jgi:hypothetical protein
LRISLQNGNLPNAPTQEYWYDFARGIFHGPHTFPPTLMQPYLNTFIMQPFAVPGTLWRSDSIQSLTSTYVENGQQMQWMYATSYLPSTETVTNKAMTEATLDIQLAPGVPPVTIAAVNSQGNIIDTVSLSGQAGATTWGSFTWGAPSIWGGLTSLLAPQELQWHLPIVFNKMQLTVQGQCAQALKVGRFEMKYQMLKSWTNIAMAS